MLSRLPRRRHWRVAAVGATVLLLSSGAAIASAATTGAGDPAPAGVTLRAAAEARGLLVGTAVNGAALGDGTIDQRYLDTLGQQYNLVVAENDFKWSFIHPAPDTYNFGPADKLVALAQANHQQVRGHNLAWYSQNPAWADAITDKATAEKALEDHIKTVVGHFKGKVAIWDVVNEAINDGDGGGLRDSVWLRTIGPDYIEQAFRWAHEADPAAKLYYNDYESGDTRAKADAVYDLVRRLKAEHVPIDGVGIQHHSRTDRHVDLEYTRNMNRLAALGLDIQITELDVAVPKPTTPAKLADQARVYAEAADFCLRQPRCTGITTWGFTDAYSWIPSSDPGYDDALPFDREYKAKPAFTALRDALTATETGRPSAAPAGVTVDAADSAVQIGWQGSAAAGTSYDLWWGTAKGQLTRHVAVPNATVATVGGLHNGTSYYFAVAAHGPGGTGPRSAVVTGKPVHALTAPVLAAVQPDHKTLELSWKPVPGATAYVVTSGTAAGALTQRVDVGPVTSYRLGGLTDGTKQYVAVQAYDASGDGPVSAVRSGTPAIQNTAVGKAPETTGTITVDGKLTEPEWAKLPITMRKPTYRSTDNVATGGITWDTQNLYVAARVTDAKLVNDSLDAYQDDAVEVFLNPKGNRPTSYDTTSDRHYFLRYGDDAVHEQNGKTAGATYHWTKIPGGWSVELAVSWKSLHLTPGEAGNRIGIDLANDDDDNGGLRDGQVTAYGYEANYVDLSAIGRSDLTVRYATTAKAVTPAATCVVDNGDGTYLAEFGYANANNGRVTLAAGSKLNRFTPGAADRGQPSVLARGTQTGIQVPFDGTALTWSLRGPDGKTRTATADKSTARCAITPAVSVYRDAPATGWVPFSYNATVDTAATTPVHGGTAAISFTVTGAYGLAGLQNKTAPVTLTPDSALDLWINTGTGSGPRTFGLVTSSGADGAAGTPAVYFTVPAGGWVEKTFDYADLGSPATIGSFFLQDVSGATTAQPPVAVDDVRVLNVKSGL